MNTRSLTINVAILLALVLSLGLAVVGGPPASAQGGKGPTAFKNVKLWVYPEYDDPRLLMMLEGKIVGADPPATVRFLVPAAAQMFSAGSMDAQGKYSGGPPRRKPSDIPGWDEISYEVKTDTFRVEYYDPIVPAQPDKKIIYEFRSLYPISDLRAAVLEPRNSSSFSITPAEHYRASVEGMITRDYDFRDLDITQPLRFEFSYTRTDTSPSVKDPVLSSTGDAASGSPMTVIGILAGVAFVLVFGFALLSRSRGRRGTRQQLRYAEARAGRSAERRAAAPRPSGGKVDRRPIQAGTQKRQNRFCRQCGQPMEGPSNFCPSCGAKQ
ncbi:MAG: zinc ribbon domain-containing protein [Chloroflexi bacterium]|nr:zinc ribbon domain-containing protein [Chloroflexota bacterium]